MTRIGSWERLIALTAVVSGCLGGDDSNKAGGEASAETVVLTLANPDDGTFDLDEFAREVENQSNGSIRIEFENSWRAGEADNEPSTIEDVRDRKGRAGQRRRARLRPGRGRQPPAAGCSVRDRQLCARARGAETAPSRHEMLGGVEDAGVVGDRTASRRVAQAARHLAAARRGVRLPWRDDRICAFRAERAHLRSPGRQARMATDFQQRRLVLRRHRGARRLDRGRAL